MYNYKLLPCLVVFVLLSAAAPARAELLHGPYDYPGAVSFAGQIGPQVSLGGFTPGGFKVLLDYNHRFARSKGGGIGVWFFGDLGFAVGLGVGVCPTLGGDYYECGALGYGSDVEIAGGIRLTFRTPVPLVPFIKLGAAITAVLGRDFCEDGGVGAPLALVGGGVRYFFTRRLAVGAEVDAHVGPAFYSGGNQRCFTGDHNELWRSLSFLLGLEYAL